MALDEPANEEGDAPEDSEDDEGDDDIGQELAAPIEPAIDTFPRAGQLKSMILPSGCRKGEQA